MAKVSKEKNVAVDNGLDKKLSQEARLKQLTKGLLCHVNVICF